jgi:rhodanese-related sulfurtransferase
MTRRDCSTAAPRAHRPAQLRSCRWSIGRAAALAVLWLLWMPGCAPSPRLDAEVSAEEAYRELLNNKNSVLVDVREPGKRSLGAPAASVSIPYVEGNDDIEFAQHVRALAGPDKEIILICGQGVLSRKALAALNRQGLDHILSVAEGYEGWKSNKLP